MRKPLIVAEIGSNWLGDVELGKRLIKECKQAGVDYVKFQAWRARELYDESHPHWKQICESELTFEKALELKSYADSIGVEWFSSVFYPEAVAWLKSLGVKVFKISHRRSPRDIEVMKFIAKTGISQICSVVSLEDAYNCIKILGNPPPEMLTLLHCVPKYPCPDGETNLLQIEVLRELPYNVGFSDHTLGITASIGAVALGARVIEKHIMLKKDTVSPDACCSISVGELKQMVTHVRRIELMRGSCHDKG